MKAEVLNEWVTLIEGDNRAAMQMIDRASIGVQAMARIAAAIKVWPGSLFVV